MAVVVDEMVDATTETDVNVTIRARRNCFDQLIVGPKITNPNAPVVIAMMCVIKRVVCFSLRRQMPPQFFRIVFVVAIYNTTMNF